MALEIVKQNAKTLIENIYEYERLVEEKASEKELKKVRQYALKLIESIRKAVEKGKSDAK